MSATDTAAADALWHRYWDIVDGHKPGFARSIAWHCALRRKAWAMLELSSRFVAEGHRSDAFSGAGLCYRAWRAGSSFGAQHLAMDAFNRGDMIGYRYWLARAALAGGEDAARELHRFETRLPHDFAPMGRKRPYRPAE